MRYISMLAIIVGVMTTTGCSTINLKEPNYVDIFKPVVIEDASGKGFEDPRLAPISNMQSAYAPYRDGAAINKATLSAIALGGAGVAAVGVATGSHSELYKASAAIIATAFGFEGWGNFKGQFSIYDEALSYLSCVKTHTKTIIENSNSNFTAAISSIRSNESELSRAYEVSVTSAEVLDENPSLQRVDGSSYRLPDGAELIIPTMRQVIKSGTIADAEVADITKAVEIATQHRVKVETDMQELQRKVTKAISESSFDTEKAVAVIAPKLSKSVGASDSAENLLDSPSTTEARVKAHAIIDAYNSYQQCGMKSG